MNVEGKILPYGGHIMQVSGSTTTNSIFFPSSEQQNNINSQLNTSTQSNIFNDALMASTADSVSLSDQSLQDANSNSQQNTTNISSNEVEKTDQSFVDSVLAKIKSGTSISDALLETKTEFFELYFQEALEENGGNVRAAVESAKTRIPSLQDEELLGIVQDLARKYSDQSQSEEDETKAQGYAEISNSLFEYAKTLQEKIDAENSLQNSTDLGDAKSKKGNKPSDAQANLTSMIGSNFINQEELYNLISSNSNENSVKNNLLQNSEMNYTEREKKERAYAAKQYEMMAGRV